MGKIMLAVVICALAVGQAQAAPAKWSCHFTATASYKGGQETIRDPARFRVTPDLFDLTFVQDDQKSYVVGNAGAAAVAVAKTDRGGVQFIEQTGSGVSPMR
jgi:hypothetical protein